MSEQENQLNGSTKCECIKCEWEMGRGGGTHGAGGGGKQTESLLPLYKNKIIYTDQRAQL